MLTRLSTAGTRPEPRRPGFALVLYRTLRGALGKLVAPFVRPEADTDERRRRNVVRVEDTAEPARPFIVLPIEAGERHGAARDEVSFEQRRRGGPVTGEAPPTARGPRHGGGGRRRGRDEVTSEILDEFSPTTIIDYDDLSVDEIRARVEGLAPDELERVLIHERSNKGRESVVALLEKKLAG